MSRETNILSSIIPILRQSTSTVPLDQQVLCQPAELCRGFRRWLKFQLFHVFLPPPVFKLHRCIAPFADSWGIWTLKFTISISIVQGGGEKLPWKHKWKHWKQLLQSLERGDESNKSRWGAKKGQYQPKKIDQPRRLGKPILEQELSNLQPGEFSPLFAAFDETIPVSLHCKALWYCTKMTLINADLHCKRTLNANNFRSLKRQGAATSDAEHIYEEIDWPSDAMENKNLEDFEEISFLNLISHERRNHLRLYGCTGWDWIFHFWSKIVQLSAVK